MIALVQDTDPEIYRRSLDKSNRVKDKTEWLVCGNSHMARKAKPATRSIGAAQNQSKALSIGRKCCRILSASCYEVRKDAMGSARDPQSPRVGFLEKLKNLQPWEPEPGMEGHPLNTGCFSKLKL